MGEQQKPQDWAALARAVTDRRVELGHRTLRSFAAASGLSTKTLGEIEGAKRSSYDRATLAQIEQALRWPAGTVVAVLRGANATEGAAVYVEELEAALNPQPLHPLAAELNTVLGPGSPLSDDAKGTVSEWVHRVLAGARLQMQGQPDPGLIVEFLSEDSDRLAAGPKGRRTPPTSLDLLAALLHPDTRMSDDARQALNQLLTAAVRLGEQAMMAWDAQHGPTDAELLERAGRAPTPTVPQMSPGRRPAEVPK